MDKCLLEFIGAFISVSVGLTLARSFRGVKKAPRAALFAAASAFIAVFVVVIFGGDAIMTPTGSIIAAASGRIRLPRAMSYITCQFLGAIAAFAVFQYLVVPRLKD